MDSEPISLRTLTILLKYERSISDVRFPNVRLINTSFVDPACKLSAEAMGVNFPKRPKTIMEEHFHHFAQYNTLAFSPEEAAAATCLIHPSAQPAIKELSLQTRDLIFNITRGSGGCSHALRLYQHFFELYPPGQEISIQLGEEEPFLVKPSSSLLLIYKIVGPKLFSFFQIESPTPQNPNAYRYQASADDEGFTHAVLTFPHPNRPLKRIVVDMTSLQYGAAAGGMYGEPYFIGTMEDWNAMMSKCCERWELETIFNELAGESEFNKNAKECAEKVWKRWQKREELPWCHYCGIPGGGVDLKQCASCRAVKYCCKEHQAADWKLHKLTCKKTRGTTTKKATGKNEAIHNAAPQSPVYHSNKETQGRKGIGREKQIRLFPDSDMRKKGRGKEERIWSSGGTWRGIASAFWCHVGDWMLKRIER
ncbi:hypothetical protein HYFRA_00010425 [Hymenoscyphus fraxineus]|uniref:MYND-type domain-containing protein n=1 Tax=Hymenoscyphus fraxineus TaxID=746836 RepID=A0A9N9PKV3_9HELO|nr:hypothetical protein HYFRA_00010425 [Hymenoscyphus fraxineus]